MKQINTLEGELGLKLFVRSPRGAVLTPAGESLERDGRKLLSQWERAVAAARQVQNGVKRVIRVGTSALYPCGELIALWDKLSGEHPEFQFQVIPFDDAQTASLRRELGKNLDVLVGPFDSLLTQEYCRLLPLGEHRFYVAMPRNHPLSGKDRIALEDLDGCRVMLQKPGNSPINDQVRGDILRGLSPSDGSGRPQPLRFGGVQSDPGGGLPAGHPGQLERSSPLPGGCSPGHPPHPALRRGVQRPGRGGCPEVCENLTA